MLLLLCLLGVVFLYVYLKYVFSYWERRGFPFVPPTIPFGNLMDIILRREPFAMFFANIYNQSKEPFIGLYMFFQPALLIRDADLAKQILTTEFSSFHDRGIYLNKNEPVGVSLLNQTGSEWKVIRQKLSPAFSSGKLKGMFATVLDVAKKLNKFVEPLAGRNEEIDVKELNSRFTLDVTASTIFGIEVDTINEPDHLFREVVKKFTRPGPMTIAKQMLTILFPSLMKELGVKLLPPNLSEFFVGIVKQTAGLREDQNIVRKDLMQLLLQIRNSVEIKDDSGWDLQKSTGPKTLSIENIAGQAILFYNAGSETTSLSMSFTLWELARAPEKMARLQTEIDESLKKNDNKITYESINGLSYLDMCLNETFRKYPGLPMLNRICTKEFNIPGTTRVIEKGTAVVVSVHGIHNDPKLFTEPEFYNPERFLNETGELNEKYLMPFGDGPRMCIAFRMGIMVAKAGLVYLLSKYNFEHTENSKFEWDMSAFPPAPAGGLKLRVKKR